MKIYIGLAITGLLSLAAMVWQRVLLTDTIRNELMNHDYTVENVFILQFVWLVLIPFYFLIGVAIRNQKTYKMVAVVLIIHSVMAISASYLAGLL